MVSLSKVAFRITLIYIVAGFAWILFSDRAVALLVQDPAWIVKVSTYKGWLFVSVTGAILFAYLKQTMGEIAGSHSALEGQRGKLAAAYAELAASEEETRAQFEELQRREDEIRRQNIVLSLVHDTAVSLLHRLEVDEVLPGVHADEVLRGIVAGAAELVGTPHGFIFRLDEENGVYIRTHGIGLYAADIGRRTPVGKGIIGKVHRLGSPVVEHDYPAWRVLNPESAQVPEIQAVMQYPLRSDGKVVGSIGLAYQEKGRGFGPYEMEALSRFAELASVALDNATLFSGLRKSQASTQALIGAIPDMLFIIRSDGTFLDFMNGQGGTLLSPAEFLGRKVAEVLPPETAARTMQAIALATETREMQLFEYTMLVRDRTEHYEARLVVSGETEVLAIVRNITDRKNMEAQLERLSLHDALTGLYNRAFFEEEMKRLAGARDGAAGLLICDVDGLKIVNDSLGHNAGDSILKSVARLLQESFRPGDIVARIGGDEFAVLLSANDPQLFEAGRRRIAERIRRLNEENPTVPISLSMGFAVSRHSPADMNALFQEADNQMYREKLHRQKSVRSSIVHALTKALEARDFIAEGHADRLQKLLESFAGKLGLPVREIGNLRLFAYFHDIGKVGIPDSILFKPGRLTEEEWAVMRQHCEIGYRIAQSAQDLAPIADWILKHQEWWNGGGYPLGLKGRAIPLECRMLAIADAFDAMTGGRPYRESMPCGEALDELRRCAGTQFDPELVELFCEMIAEKNGG